MNNPLLVQSQTKVDGDEIVPSAKTKKGRRELGWQSPETTTVENTTSARISDTSSKTPQNSQKPSQDQYLSQSKICKQWEVEMERLNAKYNLDSSQAPNLIWNQMRESNII